VQNKTLGDDVKAYVMSVLALVVVSAVAGAILSNTNPSVADRSQSQHGATRL
jgi:cation transporter-like permease